jgi:non-homologous end joining protein Ku
MGQFETRFSRVDLLPREKHDMDELDWVNLFAKHVPGAPGRLADHAESLCIMTATIICDNKPLFKIQEWLDKYSDDLAAEPVEAKLFNDERLARSLSPLFPTDHHSLMKAVPGSAIATRNRKTDRFTMTVPR